MATTTRAGYPYPVGTDRVMDGDDAIKNLATKVDQNLGLGFYYGSVTAPAPTATDLNTIVAVTFPAGRFTSPGVFTQYGGGQGSNYCCPVVTGGVNGSGCNLNYAIPAGKPLATRVIYFLVWQP